MSGFVKMGDCHLSELIWEGRPNLRGDSVFAWGQLIDYCLRERLPLLLPGDIFEKNRPDPTAVAAFIRGADAMMAARCPMYFIQGQHDRADPPWPLVHEWPQYVHHKTFEVPGVLGEFYGLDWIPRGAAPEHAEKMRPGRFLLTHQVWTELMGNRGEHTIQSFPRYEYILTGDLHQHLQLQVAGEQGPTVMVSSGALNQQRINEPEEAAFFVFREGSGFSSVKLRTRQVFRALVYDESTLEQADAILREYMESANCQTLPPELQRPILNVRIDTTKCGPGFGARVQDVLALRSHLFPTVVTAGLVMEDPVYRAPADSVNELRAAVQASLEDLKQPDLLEDILFMLESKDAPQATVTNLVQRLEAKWDSSAWRPSTGVSIGTAS